MRKREGRIWDGMMMVSLDCVRCLRYAGKSREGDERARGAAVASESGSLLSRAYGEGCFAEYARMPWITAVQPVSAMVSVKTIIAGRLAAWLAETVCGGAEKEQTRSRRCNGECWTDN